MLKQGLILGGLILNLVFIGAGSAKTKACPVQPTYNIVIKPQQVLIANPQTRLTITPDGSLELNAHSVVVSTTVKMQARQFQAYLRQQLPNFARQADLKLNEVRTSFEVAIRNRLGNDSELLNALNSLYTQLHNLLNQAIMTDDTVTYFYYQPFNNLKKQGAAIGKRVFYRIVRDSIFSLDVFKNYTTIKQIAKQEWRQQTVILKAFDNDVCELVTTIDTQYQQLMAQISS